MPFYDSHEEYELEKDWWAFVRAYEGELMIFCRACSDKEALGKAFTKALLEQPDYITIELKP